MLEGIMGGLLKIVRREKPRSTPVMGFRNTAAIAAGGYWLLDFELETQTADYFPMGNMKIVNDDSDSLVEVHPNDSIVDHYPVARRASEIYEGAVTRVRIYNRGTSEIAIGKIIVNVWNEK